jgi:diguanylate cyclase (GGDEF)-like protein
VAREDDETGAARLSQGPKPLVSAAALRRDRAYLVVVAGQNVGEMFPLGASVVIGRGSDADVRVVDDQISRRHARILVQGSEASIEDLGSKNGTFVNGAAVQREKLKDGDKVQIGTATVFRFAYHDEIEESFQRQMYESALRDPLTRIYNRKYLIDRLHSEVAYSLRHATPLSLLLFDVDHFKKINDTRGHPAGDSVLVGLARHVLRIIRTEDVFARYGGEEFAILSRGIGLEGSKKFAERLRAAIGTYPFMHEQERIHVTISIGISSMPRGDVAKAEDLVSLADQALYQAKGSGRNRVCLA